MNRKELFGCFVVEQADVDPREIEVVEATARNEFIIVHQPNLSTSSLYQTYKNTNAFLASARVLVRIALHKCSRKVLTVLMFCKREAQRDDVRAGAAGETSDVPEAH
jgi:hypothetical protein